MNKGKPEKMLKISEVSSASGATVQTIHYYLREGLLTPPVKTSRNMAYYDAVVVDEIRYIKELQKKQYLPISVIKTMMEARRQGQEGDHIKEMQSFFERVFQNNGTDTPKSLSLPELIENTGLDKDTIGEMQKMGIFTPNNGEDGGRFDQSDECIGRLVKRLLDLGLKTPDLVIYGQYLELICKEFKIMRSISIRRVHDGSITLNALNDIVKDLKIQLYQKGFRQVLSEPGARPNMHEN